MTDSNNNLSSVQIPDHREDPADGAGSLEAALAYLKLGWPVIPVGWDKVRKGWKKPLIEWQRYQVELPSPSDIDAWWKKWPFARVGIVTGSKSGLVVVDVDTYKGANVTGLDLPATLTAKTGGGGDHYLYAHPRNGCVIPDATGWPREGIDIRGDGGLIVAPPSLHISGERYEWGLEFDPSLIAPCPQWLLEKGEKDQVPLMSLLNGVPEGQRNDAAARVIGLILSELPPEEWEGAGWHRAVTWNNKCRPPMSQKELAEVFRSIANREIKQRRNDADSTNEGGKKKKKSRTAEIAETMLELPDKRLFHDKMGKAYIQFQRDNHWELWPCESEEVSSLISYLHYKQSGSPANPNVVEGIVRILKAQARYDGDCIDPGLRVTQGTDDALYYDLVDKEWRVVEVREDGWTIVNKPSAYLKRFNHTSAQAIPVKDGDVSAILDFVNLRSKDDQLLFLCYLVSCFIPDIQHPILVISGGKGTAKSTFTDTVKNVVDPSALSRIPFPKKPDEFALIMSQHWMIAFDNVSKINEELSNLLCMASTGGGFSKRRLYRDEEPIVTAFRRCVVMNGINIPAEKPDLMDRILFFNLEVISKGSRKSERRFQADFEAALPKILGGVFDTLSHAMRYRKEIVEESLSRLSDFDLWGRAIAKALGYQVEDFIRALTRNAAKQNEESIRQSPVATAVVAFIEKQPLNSWEGEPSLLLKNLEEVTIGLKIDTHDQTWPKSPAVLSRMLNEVSANLAEEHIKITHHHDGKKRFVRIELLTHEQADTNPTNDTNGIFL